MNRKSIGILILIFCLGLVMTGCPKKTVMKEEPSLMKTEELAVEREQEKKIEAERETKEAQEKELVKIREEEATKAKERESIKIREEEATKAKEREFEKSFVVKKAPGIEGEILENSFLKDVNFDFDKYEIRLEDTEILKENAVWLRKYPNMKIQIEGHCDERGTVEYNLALGERRANSTRNYLVSLGISPERISTISYGEEKPLVLSHDEEAWAKNRRAHCIILSKK
jgi:peptidoglycan-associated lipoprotein